MAGQKQSGGLFLVSLQAAMLRRAQGPRKQVSGPPVIARLKAEAIYNLPNSRVVDCFGLFASLGVLAMTRFFLQFFHKTY